MRSVPLWEMGVEIQRDLRPVKERKGPAASGPGQKPEPCLHWRAARGAEWECPLCSSQVPLLYFMFPF